MAVNESEIEHLPLLNLAISRLENADGESAPDVYARRGKAGHGP